MELVVAEPASLKNPSQGMCCRAEIRSFGLVEKEGSLSQESRRMSVPPGVVLHDNLLFDDDAQIPLLEDGKATTSLEAPTPEDDSITRLCEEVSRLFVQYNAEFKRTKKSSRTGLGVQSNMQLRQNFIRLCSILRCVESDKEGR